MNKLSILKKYMRSKFKKQLKYTPFINEINISNIKVKFYT